MPRAWTRVTERTAKPMRSRWLAWAAFVFGAADRVRAVGPQVNFASFGVIVVRDQSRDSPVRPGPFLFDLRVLFAYNDFQSGRLQIGGQKFWTGEWFFNTDTLHPQCGPQVYCSSLPRKVDLMFR